MEYGIVERPHVVPAQCLSRIWCRQARNYNKCHRKSIKRRKDILKISFWKSEKDVEVEVFRNFWFVPMANNHIWMHDVNIAMKTHISLPQFSRQPVKAKKGTEISNECRKFLFSIYWFNDLHHWDEMKSK